MNEKCAYICMTYWLHTTICNAINYKSSRQLWFSLLHFGWCIPIFNVHCMYIHMANSLTTQMGNAIYKAAMNNSTKNRPRLWCNRWIIIELAFYLLMYAPHIYQ